MIEPVIIGDCALYLGDCLEILPTLGKVDAVVTDPPYGIGNNPATARPSNYQRQKGMAARKWDKSTVLIDDIIALAPIQVVWGGNYYALAPSRGWLSWFKPDAVPTMASIELAWTNQDQNARQISCSISATNAERCGHPTQKPLAVMLWTLRQIPYAETVLDPFAGSFTTGVACIRLGRRFVGIERDPAYFEMGRRRIEDAYRQGDMFRPAPATKAQQMAML